LLRTLLLLGAAQFGNGPPLTAEVFVVKPYLQLGNSPKLASPEGMVVMWHAPDRVSSWLVETKASGRQNWSPAGQVEWRRVAVEGIEPHRVYSAVLSGLTPGAEFEYRILQEGQMVFAARSRARKSFAQPYRLVVVGDCSQDSPGQKAIAYQIHHLNPDLIVVPGDIVYNNGRISEYRRKFYPIYNADEAS
jgi:hypothetical protein